MASLRLFARGEDEVTAPSSNKPTFHIAPVKIVVDGRGSLRFIIAVCVIAVVLLYLLGVAIYVKKEVRRQKAGKKPRWGIALLRALTIPTLLFIPIMIYKSCFRNRKKARYNKLDEGRASQAAQSQWYGAGPPPAPYAGPSAGGVSVSISGGNGTSYRPSAPLVASPYDSQPVGAPPVYYGHDNPEAHYDAPPSLPMTAPGSSPYHQPPPPAESQPLFDGQGEKQYEHEHGYPPHQGSSHEYYSDPAAGPGYYGPSEHR